MWETEKGQLSFSGIMEVVRGEQYFTDEALDRTSEGKEVENGIIRALNEKRGPDKIEELRLTDFVHNKRHAALINGLKITTTPDVFFEDRGARKINMVEIKARGYPMPFDALQGAIALWVMESNPQRRMFNSSYRLYYDETSSVWRVQEAILGNVAGDLGLLCQAAIVELAPQKVKELSEKRDESSGNYRVGLWEMAVPAALSLAKKELPNFLEIYNRVVDVAKEFLVYEAVPG